MTDPDPVSEPYIPQDASPASQEDSDTSHSNSVAASTANPPTLVSSPAKPDFPTLGQSATPPGIAEGELTATTSMATSSSFGVSSVSMSHILTTSYFSSSISTTSFMRNSSVVWSNSSSTHRSTVTSIDTVGYIEPGWSSPNDPGSTAKKSSCDVTLSQDQPWTVFSIVPNTTTLTLTITGNHTPTYTPVPEFTPPKYCTTTSNTTDNYAPGYTQPPSQSSNPVPFEVVTGSRPTTTFITTEKNPPVVTTSILYPSYPGGSSTMQSMSITDAPPMPSTEVIDADTTYYIGDGTGEETAVDDGQPLTFGPGGIQFDQTIPAPQTTDSTNVVVLSAQLFTAEGSTAAIIGGTTIAYGKGIPATTDVVDGDSITIGPSGISFHGSTLGGPANPIGTQYGIIGGVTVSEVGSTLAVVDGVTLTVGPNATPSTAVINGHTVTADSVGLGLGGNTLSFPFNPASTQAVIAGGITFSEVGSSMVVIGGTTFTFGPGATPTTDLVNGQTIVIGPSGVGFKTTTFTGTGTSTGTGALPTQTSKKKNGAAGLPRVRIGYGVLGFCIVVGVGFWL